MATVVGKWDVRSVAQVTAWVFAGTWEATDIVTVTIGSKAVSTTTGSTVITTLLDTLVTALNAVTDNEFAEIIWSRSSTSLVGTAETAGKTFIATVSTTDVGGAADAQTIDGATSSVGVDSTACTGPNFANVAGNYVGGSLPVDADTVIFADSEVDVLCGLDLNAVTPAAIYFDSSYTGNIGLPTYSETGNYYEYRTRYLAFGVAADATNMAVYVGHGPGNGSPRINFNAGTGQVTVNVANTANSINSNDPAFKFKGTHASNVFSVNKGSVGIASDPGSAAVIATLNVGYIDNPEGDSDVVCGIGTTLTTINVSGGSLLTRSAYTTLNMTGGVVSHMAGAITTINLDSGTFIQRSNGTITTLKVGSNGVFDCSHDMQARTVTNVELHAGATWRDPFGTVTVTNGFDFVRCSPSEVTWDVVPHRTWTPTGI